MSNRIKRNLCYIGITFLILVCATIIGGLFSYSNIPDTNVVVVYVFSVLLVARLTKGYLCGLLATIASIFLFNWFFTTPIYTLKVNDPTYFITFLIMTIISVITSTLTTKVKESAIEATEKETETEALYKLTKTLTKAEDKTAIANVILKTVSSIFLCCPVLVFYEENGELEKEYIHYKDGSLRSTPIENYDDLNKRLKNPKKSYYISSDYYDYPIYGKTKVFAVLRIPKEKAEIFDLSQTRLLHSVIESASLALERLCSLQAQAKSHEEAVKEHYRGNLLRSISHDIRTPLSGIMGSGEILMNMTDKQDPRYEIAEGIYKDANWLYALVENILNLTKIQDGKLLLNKTNEAVEEVVGAAIMVVEKRAPEREISVLIPDALIMVPMDARLISQVIVNLLDNAVKHTPMGNEIRVEVSVDYEVKEVIFRVLDRGSGINENDLPNVFQMFYTTRGKSTDSQRGIGLGLAICQSIIEAHGGRITAQNRPGGGAMFEFTLPMEMNKNENS